MLDEDLIARRIAELERSEWVGPVAFRGGLPKVPIRTALPTLNGIPAGIAQAYAILVLEGTPDTFYVCLRDGAGTWGWVNLSVVNTLTAVDFLVGTASGDLSAEIVVGTTPGGELGGTWAAPTVDTTHSGSTHSTATDTHIADTSDAHDASAISILDTAGDFTATDVEGALAELQSDAESHVAAADPHTVYVLVSGDTMTGNLSLDTFALTGANTNNRQKFKYHSALADNGVAQVAPTATPSAMIIVVSDQGYAAGFTLRNGFNGVEFLYGSATEWSTTAGTAAKTNVYYSAGNARYEIENKRGGARSYSVFIFEQGATT
mgnify:CR=1 FL=1